MHYNENRCTVVPSTTVFQRFFQVQRFLGTTVFFGAIAPEKNQGMFDAFRWNPFIFSDFGTLEIVL